MDEEKIIKCLDEKCKRYFSSGEYCTINTAREYGLSDTKNIKNVFDKNIVPDEDIIDKYIDNTIDRKKTKSICNLKGNTATPNCALYTQSPWFTINENNTKCSIPSDLKLPPGFLVKEEEGETIIIKSTEDDIRKYSTMDAYCQEKWFDWFTIPDYHLGNIYIAKKRKLSELQENPNLQNDILKCYVPCPIGTVPYNNGDWNNMGKCINRNDFAYGAFRNTSYYTPLAFINLLGNTTENLKEYYKDILKTTSNVIQQNQFKKLKDNIVDYVYNTDSITDNIVNEAKYQMSYNIFNFIEHTSGGFTYQNIVEPNDALKSMINPLTSTHRLVHSYKIMKNLHKMLENYDKGNIYEYDKWLDEMKTIYFKGYTDNDINTRGRSIHRGQQKDLTDRLLKILKKASNICFSGENTYSKDYILYTLNTSGDFDKFMQYEPFKFDIAYTKKEPTLETQREINHYNNRVAQKSNSNDNNVNKFDQELTLLEKQTCPYKEKDMPDPISYIKLFIYLLYLSLLIYLIIILADVIGPYVIIMVNWILVQLRNLWYKLWDIPYIMRNKYVPSTFDVNRAKGNLANIIKRFNTIQNSIKDEFKSKKDFDDAKTIGGN